MTAPFTQGSLGRSRAGETNLNLTKGVYCMKKLVAFIFTSVCMLGLFGCSSESASIGIIGGADGPTAIFVTSNINWLYVCGFIGIVVAILVALFFYRNKKKK